MSKLRILIVEDKSDEADSLSKTLTEFGYEVVGVSNDPDDAYELFLEKRPQLCLIDIYLEGRPDGVTFARKLIDSNENLPILFLTGNYDNLTFYLAKTANPENYLLKPYNPLELQYAIELAIDKVRKTQMNETTTLFIKRGNNLSRVNVHDIKYIEVDGKYSKIYSTTERFLVQQPLKDLQLQLPSTLFSRIHRNYLVNINEVIRIDIMSNEVLFKDGTSLSFSRRYFDSLLEYFRVFK